MTTSNTDRSRQLILDGINAMARAMTYLDRPEWEQARRDLKAAIVDGERLLAWMDERDDGDDADE